MLFEKLSKTLDLGSILLQPWRLTVKDLIYRWTVQIAKNLAFYIFQESSWAPIWPGSNRGAWLFKVIP